MGLSASQSAQLFGEVEAYLTQANTLLQQGDMQTLATLGPKVDEMCEALAQLPAATSQEQIARITHITSGLTALIVAMGKSREQISQALNSAGKHHKAARAYLTTPPSGTGTGT